MDYDIQTQALFGALARMDVGALADGCTVPWWNRTLCRVNDSVVRLGVFQGEFHWHQHEREDELFFVLEGRLRVDLPDRTFDLGPREAVLVPKGVTHRTRAPERAVVLMVEAATVAPKGD